MRILTTIFVLFLVLLGVTFAGLNAEPVSVNYYVGSAKLPLSLLLVLSLVCGGLLSLLFSAITYVRLKSANVRLRQRLKVMDEEIANLRTMPLKDAH